MPTGRVVFDIPARAGDQIGSFGPMSHADAPSPAAADSRPWYKKKRFMIPIGVIVLFAFIGSLGETETTPTADDKKPANETAAAAPAVPKTPEGKLLAAVKKTNADNPKVVDYRDLDDGSGKYAIVNFKVGDNFSNGTIRTGIAKDVFAMAEAALKSGVPFEEISFRGLFPLTDEYGNTKAGQVFFATFDRATLKKINFDNILATQFDNIENLSIDGIVMLHPDLRE